MGLTMGCQEFVVMPWRVASTPRNMLVWQGNVQHGITVRAVTWVPARPIFTRLGVVSEVTASARNPSMLTRIAFTRVFYGAGLFGGGFFTHA
jgi:hypothetical protein